MLLCIGAVNTHLIKLGLRGYVSINVQTGDALDTHSFATLIGVGATTVNPYLAFDSLFERYSKKLFGNLSFDECVSRFIKSVNLGLLKIMSKMGISVLSSYRGGCNFETVGLSRTIVKDFFPGVLSKISGIGLTGIEKKLGIFTNKHSKTNLIYYQLEEYTVTGKTVRHINTKVN